MTKIQFGPTLLWTDRENNWDKIEWYRLMDNANVEEWIEKHCKSEVWTKMGSYGWNRAYYFENPKEALLFRVAWT